MNKILVTPRSVTKTGHPSLVRLQNAGYEIVFCTAGVQPSEEELINILPDCVGYLAGVEKITSRVLYAAKELKTTHPTPAGPHQAALRSC